MIVRNVVRDASRKDRLEPLAVAHLTELNRLLYKLRVTNSMTGGYFAHKVYEAGLVVMRAVE